MDTHGSVLPDARTAGVWLAIHVAFPVVLSMFGLGGILAVEGQQLGLVIAIAAWLAMALLIAANGWVYAKVKRAQRAPRGRTGGGVGLLRAIMPLPRTVDSALRMRGTAVPPRMPVMISAALLGIPVLASLAVVAYLAFRH